MACHDKCYLPIPPRAWSRVQNSCSVETTDSNNSLVRVPYTNQIVPGSEISFYLAMQNKGNVLQYKANSSNFTKNQIYSLAAKGLWLGKTTGVQSTRGYTNPNSTSLQRTGNVVNVAIDPNTGLIIGPTTAPVTCPTPIRPFNPALPNNGGGGGIAVPPIPPVINPDPGSIIFPPIIPVTPVEPIVIQDGGTLVCSVKENICTGKTSQTLSQKLCNLTTDSDVPGPIQPLCWNDGNPTWYPRQRYTMSNSTNKWPINATLSSAIRPYPPIITSISSNINVVTLTWTQDESCLPVSRFNIFQNGLLIQNLSGSVFTTNIIVENCNFYQYYIVGVASGNDVFSDPSNIETINIAYVETPINLNYTVINYSTKYIQLTWDIKNVPCITVSYYKIYQNNGLIVYTTTNKNINITISYCDTYSFYVKAIDINGQESQASRSIDVILYIINPPTNLNYTTINSGEILLSWNASTIGCNLENAPSISYYNIYINNNIYTSSTTNIIINGLINCGTYPVYIIAVASNSEASDPSDLIYATVLWVNPPTNLNWITSGSGEIFLSWSLPNPNCVPPDSYNIYIDSIFLANTNSLNYTISGLINCSNYSIAITSVSNSNESIPVILNNVIPLWPNPPILSGLPVQNDYSSIILNWTNNSQCVTISNFKLYKDGSYFQTYSSNTFTTTISGLPIGSVTTFYITAISGSNESNGSNTLSIEPIITTISHINSGNYINQINVQNPLYYDVIVIGGGGAGGAGIARSFNQNSGGLGGSGGGGGGMSKSVSIPITTQILFTSKVGAGGIGTQFNGLDGTFSQFTDSITTIIAYGGKGGKHDSSLYGLNDPTVNTGGLGGSSTGGQINISGGNGGDSGSVPGVNSNIPAQPGSPASSSDGPGGGGGGGCLTLSSGQGAVYTSSNGGSGGSGGNGQPGGPNGGGPTSDGTGTLGYGGSGGGGGNGNIFSGSGVPTPPGGDGIYGSGGGAGGASHTSSNQGLGGKGGDGVVIISLYSISIN